VEGVGWEGRFEGVGLQGGVECREGVDVRTDIHWDLRTRFQHRGLECGICGGAMHCACVAATKIQAIFPPENAS
jgi:hypothetical protein